MNSLFYRVVLKISLDRFRGSFRGQSVSKRGSNAMHCDRARLQFEQKRDLKMARRHFTHLDKFTVVIFRTAL